MNPYAIFLLVVGAVGLVVALIMGAEGGAFLLVGVVALVGATVLIGMSWQPVRKPETKTQPSSLNSGGDGF